MPIPSHPAMPHAPGQRMNGQCPVCGTAYDFQKLNILAERDQTVLTHVVCANCSTAIISVFSLGRSGMTARGLVTDLTADEVGDIESGESVIDNDVIDFHAYLERGGTIFTDLEAADNA